MTNLRPFPSTVPALLALLAAATLALLALRPAVDAHAQARPPGTHR